MSYEVRKWYPWTGGKCPVHRFTKVVCKFDDGAERSGRAELWDWKEGAGIVAFEVVEEYKEPREWWVLLSHFKGVSSELCETKEQAEDNMADTNELIKVREVKE